MAKEKPKEGETNIVRNKRASFDYELGERFEAGVVLTGSEVKMPRHGSADLTDSWCLITHAHEAFLNGVNIPEMPGAAFNHEPKRSRKLLLHAQEIETLKRGIDRDGMTVAATRLYFKGGRVKVELALAKGKKKGDKRQAIKAQDAAREARVAISRGRKGD